MFALRVITFISMPCTLSHVPSSVIYCMESNNIQPTLFKNEKFANGKRHSISLMNLVLIEACGIIRKDIK